ncbi:MAG: type II toxin-antitoxin system HicB family antitoxin [Verrucomicrobiota bacterium]
MKKKTDKYYRWVEWSEEDQAYVGYCPDLFGGGCHGDDPIEVARELQQVIDEWEEVFETDGTPYPPVRTRPMMELA